MSFLPFKEQKKKYCSEISECPIILIKSDCFLDCNKYSFIRSVSPIFVKSIFMLLIL